MAERQNYSTSGHFTFIEALCTSRDAELNSFYRHFLAIEQGVLVSLVGTEKPIATYLLPSFTLFID